MVSRDSAALKLHLSNYGSRNKVVQLSQRDRAAGCVRYGQTWKTETGRQYFTDIIRFIFNHCDNRRAELSNSVKKRKIRGTRCSRSCKVIKAGTNRKPVCNLLLVINWYPISYRFGAIASPIVQIFDTLRYWAPSPWGLRDNVRCSSWAHWKARSGLPISVNWTFFAMCYSWGAMSENRSKIGDFAPTRSVWPKISGRMGCPP